MNDQDIVSAAEIAGVSEFANWHPRGFDMAIGERGESLSGGQRQAVGIARRAERPAHSAGRAQQRDGPSERRCAQDEASVICQRQDSRVITHRSSLLEW